MLATVMYQHVTFRAITLGVPEYLNITQHYFELHDIILNYTTSQAVTWSYAELLFFSPQTIETLITEP